MRDKALALYCVDVAHDSDCGHAHLLHQQLCQGLAIFWIHRAAACQSRGRLKGVGGEVAKRQRLK